MLLPRALVSQGDLSTRDIVHTDVTLPLEPPVKEHWAFKPSHRKIWGLKTKKPSCHHHPQLLRLLVFCARSKPNVRF